MKTTLAVSFESESWSALPMTVLPAWMPNTEHPTSNIQHRTSNIEHPTSNIQHRTSNIERPTSNVQHRTSNIERPTSNVQHPTSKPESVLAKTKSAEYVISVAAGILPAVEPGILPGGSS